MEQLIENIGVCRTADLPNPTYYVDALTGEFSSWAYCEEKSPTYRGQWRSEVFQVSDSHPLDLEIGTGNGYHFAHYAKNHPERSFIGIEKKYKPLIQAIRRALNEGCDNARILRYNANYLSHLFEKGELNDVHIHFPDPWLKKRQKKHRLIQESFLKTLHELQRPGSKVEFKTDSRDYFDWAVERFQKSPYQITRLTYDLHGSEFQKENFVTHFEQIFLQQGLPIHYAQLQR
ncbi:MAG: tRNA (guanosine(46)-N7)-methyltransferase TrmB [Pseudobdellovibrionaceae bacterium]|nr:tRNA (guanosine(46)-N7)-methyltransferase TrmB [Bdellovibrionales bacterium]USN47168.1 MAG: tRNA (guanosine(46)-N7)-methyltransferase TrmB [Pseudobdellovibrionaceae bacterium]